MKVLNTKEINILVEALEAWENKDLGSELMMGLFTAMICRDDPDAKSKMEIEESERREKMEREKTERKETSLMLKAKLIEMKRESIVGEANKILSTNEN